MSVGGTKAQACNCKHDRLWVRLPFEEKKYIYLHFFALVTPQHHATHHRHSTPPDFNLTKSGERKRLNRNSVLTLHSQVPAPYPAINAGYSVKLDKKKENIKHKSVIVSK